MAIIILMIFIASAFSGGSHIQIKGAQTMALAKSKQIGLALNLFAGDHDGKYPEAGVPKAMETAPTNSNQAFACLFPDYLQNETSFANKLSAYQTRVPDNKIDQTYTGQPGQTLQPGENVYGYVMGLTTKSDPELPLVVDGTDGRRHYTAVLGAHGGTWGKSKKAVVIHIDNSGTVATLAGPDTSLYIPRPADPLQNVLDEVYLGLGTRLLDPAIANHAPRSKQE